MEIIDFIFKVVAPASYWIIMTFVGFYGLSLSLFSNTVNKHTRLALFIGAVICLDYSGTQLSYLKNTHIGRQETAIK